MQTLKLLLIGLLTLGLFSCNSPQEEPSISDQAFNEAELSNHQESILKDFYAFTPSEESTTAYINHYKLVTNSTESKAGIQNIKNGGLHWLFNNFDPAEFSAEEQLYLLEEMAYNEHSLPNIEHFYKLQRVALEDQSIPLETLKELQKKFFERNLEIIKELERYNADNESSLQRIDKTRKKLLYASRQNVRDIIITQN
ncbi:MAG: hypothetical protein RQ756_05240 [Flavobacteriaceae bacterium]|nr:hypothetical protein [Flavobacteriaceae bacterium]